MSTRCLTRIWRSPDPHSSISLPVSMRWKLEDPLVVSLEFPDQPNGDEVIWTFGRDLFADCFSEGQAGCGDVRLSLNNPDRTWAGPYGKPVHASMLTLHLCSPFGEIILVTELGPIMEFVTETYKDVERGAENIYPSLDRELEEVFRDFGPGDTLI